MRPVFSDFGGFATSTMNSFHPHFPGLPDDALGALRETAHTLVDDLRWQSARDRARLDLWLADHLPAGVTALERFDVAVDRVLAWLRHLWHLSGRVLRKTHREARSAARRADAAVAARLDDHGQHHLAHGLLSAVAALMMVGAVAALPSAEGETPAVGRDLAVGRRAVNGEIAGEGLAPALKADKASEAPQAPAAAVAAPTKPWNPSKGALPVGKGMWLYLPERVEGGNVDALVARAQAVGITHVYVRTGSSKSGFYAGPYLDVLLPKAHAAGIRVYGWDFPYLDNPEDDVNRAMAAITHKAPGGHRIDGFSADIELRSMGVRINSETAGYYGYHLRTRAGERFPLIATVPRPSPALITYPYADIVRHFDAIAPMVYWMNRDPATDVAGAMVTLSQFGKPVIPVGQAYDGAAEGGPVGVPPATQIRAFMSTAQAHGARAVSFWSWQHADQQAWDAIQAAPEFTLPAHPAPQSTADIGDYQYLLKSMGFPVVINGQMDASTVAAVRKMQARRGLPVTGVIDAATKATLLQPYRVRLG